MEARLANIEGNISQIQALPDYYQGFTQREITKNE